WRDFAHAIKRRGGTAWAKAPEAAAQGAGHTEVGLARLRHSKGVEIGNSRFRLDAPLPALQVIAFDPLLGSKLHLEKEKPVERPLKAPALTLPAPPPAVTAAADAGSVQSCRHGSRKGPGGGASGPLIDDSHHCRQSRRTSGGRRRERALRRAIVGRRLVPL